MVLLHSTVVSAALLALVVVGVVGFWNTASHAEIVVVPLKEYALSTSCRDCHLAGNSGWRPQGPAAAPDLTSQRDARLVGAAVRTAGTRAEEGRDVLCAYCHLRGKEKRPAAPEPARKPAAETACDGLCPLPGSAAKSRSSLPASVPHRIPQGG